jgi:hypothetical protein
MPTLEELMPGEKALTEAPVEIRVLGEPEIGTGVLPEVHDGCSFHRRRKRALAKLVKRRVRSCLFGRPGGRLQERVDVCRSMPSERCQLQKSFARIQPMQMGGPFKRPRHLGFPIAT